MTDFRGADFRRATLDTLLPSSLIVPAENTANVAKHKVISNYYVLQPINITRNLS